ncbi:hypothetical protein PIB30_038322 [Stylosanthes scabra]|uniref:Uncharacterized protein n=1 Tax=Stylosanthes scabra TaxID=79078 RepID=A0ABU6VDA2_9FABA|nr:hypothetical protein [Stylosanthes scabra]
MGQDDRTGFLSWECDETHFDDAYASVKPCVRILYVGGTPKRLFRHRCVQIRSFYAGDPIEFVSPGHRSEAPYFAHAQEVLVTSGYSWEPGAESRTPSNTCSKCELNPELWTPSARDKGLSELQRMKVPAPSGRVTSHSSTGSLLFDLEIERTLRRTRQARHRAKLARLALNNNPFSDSSSDFDTQSSSSVSSTSTMAERLTLKQLGCASTAFDNQPNRFLELNANFELKSGLINLLPKFCGRPSEGPVEDKCIQDVMLERLGSQITQKRMYSQLEIAMNMMIQSFQIARSKHSVKGNTLDAVTLRSGTRYKGPTPPVQSTEPPTQDLNTSKETENNKVIGPTKERDTYEAIHKKTSHLPYPSTTKKTRKTAVIDERIMKILEKVEVTLPLFKIIKQVPKYAKALKDVCIHKNKIDDLAATEREQTVSSMRGLQYLPCRPDELPKKYED